jgi:hypothetical protein
MTYWKCILWLTFILVGNPLARAEDWKGEPTPTEFSFGGLTGLGVVNGSGGPTLIGTVSKKIVHRGFIPDIRDSVSLEGSLGPVFLTGITPWIYSVHLRWDFEKDETWIFFATGGIGGNYRSYSLAGGNSQTDIDLTPRFSAGAFLKVTPQVWLRGEVAHDLIGVGVNIPI